MSHLEDRLADFVFEELSSAEMENARRHVSQCLECQGRVTAFAGVRQSLERLPDRDVPKRLMFVEASPAGRSGLRFWAGWAAPAAAAAALVVVLALGGVQLEWGEAGASLAFGRVAPPLADPAPPVAVPVVAEAPRIDYDRIVTEVVADQQAWLESELGSRLRAVENLNGRELQAVRAELEYLAALQRAALRDTLENASSIQLLAQRTEVRE